jgi:hypothetical protein|tara:strand:- start:404 stop:667 length:264 start_codon:yes stop_codon:yes gene_type:complete
MTQYDDGFRDGYDAGYRNGIAVRGMASSIAKTNAKTRGKTTPRKLSAWNKFVKANSKKKIFKFASGKLKLKKMGVAFRKTPAGRKKK